MSELSVATPREDAIKSGFIYNFARYSEGQWFDAMVSERYNICSFNSAFIDVANNTLKGRTINKVPVSTILLTSNFVDVETCNTLFISKNEIDKWNTLIERKLLSDVMLVGEFDSFMASGGHINFFIVGGKIRFEINPRGLKQSGINMSSKVLRLGRTNKGGM